MHTKFGIFFLVIFYFFFEMVIIGKMVNYGTTKKCQIFRLIKFLAYPKFREKGYGNLSDYIIKF